jgi:uncharacterized membrane protein YkoI
MQHARMTRTLFLLLLAASFAVAAAPPRDHERARAAHARGDFVPLETILADAERRQPGRVVDVELEDDDEYEIEILRADGVMVELEYDARTGKLVELEVEDDD